MERVDLMADNPKPEAIFNEILPFLAEHRPDILHECKVGMNYEELMEHIAKQLKYENWVEPSWHEVQGLIFAIKRG